MDRTNPRDVGRVTFEKSSVIRLEDAKAIDESPCIHEEKMATQSYMSEISSNSG